MSNEIYIGRKLHYLGMHYGVYSAIYASITNIIDDSNIEITNESGRKFTIKKHWVTDINRIVVPEGEKVERKQDYLKCQCGSMRFSYDTENKTYYCSECYAGYDNTEFGMLEKTEYIALKQEIRVLN